MKLKYKLNEGKDDLIYDFFWDLLKTAEKSKKIIVKNIDDYDLDDCAKKRKLSINVSQYKVSDFEDQCKELESIVKSACKPYGGKYTYYEDSNEFDIVIEGVKLYVIFD